MNSEMDKKARLYFRDQLREARATAYQDAEASQQIFFVLEHLGIFLQKKIEGLHGYKKSIEKVASRSPLFNDFPQELREWHIPFANLYDLVRDGRNDALHVGAYARHLTSHAVQLSLILEDALMFESNRVSDFMVRDPVQAFEWQPLSFVRQQMLVNSFSFLPMFLQEDSTWYLLSDYSLAQYLREPSKTERKKRLAITVGSSIQSKAIKIDKATCIIAKTAINEAMEQFDGKPILVVEMNDQKKLIGIITAFDVL
ncbi:MAG: hypothetical protein H6668_15300 [Ardenticatenaceae bacterium]|nr:hypothetical protein [Ardenticatenaceae bacterium]